MRSRTLPRDIEQPLARDRRVLLHSPSCEAHAESCPFVGSLEAAAMRRSSELSQSSKASLTDWRQRWRSLLLRAYAADAAQQVIDLYLSRCDTSTISTSTCSEALPVATTY